MILKIDAAQLEWRVKVFLAQDPVGMKEIEEMEAGTFDIHTDNQTKFKLPTRTIAKNFVYQMIFSDAFGDQGFKGSAFGFAGKADFQHVSTKPEYWLGVVTAFFEKYKGIHDHSVHLIRTAAEKGRITVPSGRFYPFQMEHSYRGLDWPRTKILNYPIQGFSADLVQIARLTLWEEYFKARAEFGDCLLINTVHDDIEADVDNNPNLLYNTCIAMEKAFRGIPERFEKMYGSKINVPMAGEVKFGMNLNEANMVKFKAKSFEQDYKNYIEQWQKRTCN